MGLFERKNCVRCNKELNLIFGKTKIADGHICKECNALLSPLITGKAKLTLKDIEAHLQYREENKNALKNFRATTVLGDKQKLYLDDARKLFVVYSSNDYVAKNIDVIALDQVSSCEINIDEDEEEILKQDKDGNDVSYDPPRFIKTYKYSIDLGLNHPWINNITIDVGDGEIKEDEKDELLRVDNLANEIVAKLNGTKFLAKTSIGASDENHWACPKCGNVNELNSKFCTNCGEAKASGQKFCGECGTKLPEGTKFCPNCGKAVN